mgnify:CR=1 FL=1
MRYYLIIPASGEGKRFGSKVPKQFIRLEKTGEEVISHTLRKFNSIKFISSISIAVNSTYISKVNKLISVGGFNKVTSVVKGGTVRQESVFNALRALDCNDDDIVVIHDAVRPFISKKRIREMCREAVRFDCLIPGLKINDTVKKADNKNIVTETIPRNNIWRIQTPQFFKYRRLMDAFEYAEREKITGTDEASLSEAAGIKVKIVQGEVTNIKITTKDDLRKVDFTKLLSK